jgi:CRP-like cAMP-binding protein
VPETVPLFARLTPDEDDAFRSLSMPREVADGAEIVHRWDMTRELFVLERGLVDVVRDGELVATLRCGDYFGEIGALEWGAGFARSRVASVVARQDVSLRVLEPTALVRLLDAFPRLDAEIRRTAHTRLLAIP